MAKPERATPHVSAKLATKAVCAWATTKKKRASQPNPPQLKSFLTEVVDKMPFLRRLSASNPPRGTIIVINRCGRAPIKPVCVKIINNGQIIFHIYRIRMNFTENGHFVHKRERERESHKYKGFFYFKKFMKPE